MQLLLAGDDSERGVVEAGDALRRRMQREVHAVGERLLAEWRGERRVDHRDRAAQRAELVEVDQLEARVRRGLGERQHRAAGPHGGGEGAGLGAVDERGSMPMRWHGPCRNARVPAYSWRWATMWSPAEQRAKMTVAMAPMPDANAKRVVGALQRGDRLLERAHRRDWSSGCRTRRRGSRSPAGWRRARPSDSHVVLAHSAGASEVRL